jgi:capsular polysaccharide biosynthesis protein
MTEDQYNENIQQPTDEQEIDLLELAQKLWKERKLIIKVCCAAAVVGLVVAFSIPKEFTTTVTLAPELSGKSSSGGLSSLAALAGVNMNQNSGGDALTVNLYPDIVSSVPFLTGLFDVHVADEKSHIDTTLYDYMLNEQKAPWWGSVIGAPFKLLGWTMSLFTDKPEENGDGKVDSFQLTQEETQVMNAIDNSINVSVDNKTGVTTIDVTMQSALISATVTDTVMNRLKEYITEYRTMKARHDLAYTQKLYDESRDEYYKAQQRYARYVDSNQSIILSSYRTESERLQNEMNLAYNVYNQTAQQLQMAKAKVMEITPVYTVVQPATVPLRASKPKKAMVLIGFVFMGFVATSAWILFGRDFFATVRTRLTEEEKEPEKSEE